MPSDLSASTINELTRTLMEALATEPDGMSSQEAIRAQLAQQDAVLHNFAVSAQHELTSAWMNEVERLCRVRSEWTNAAAPVPDDEEI